MWFRTLESKESHWALPVVLAVIVMNVVLRSTAPGVLAVSCPIVGLIAGVGVGWVLGEFFVTVSNVGKVVSGAFSALFLTSVTLDQLKHKVEPFQQKVFYLFSLVPIHDPRRSTWSCTSRRASLWHS